MFSTDEKLEVVEALIEQLRMSGPRRTTDLEILKAIAKDIRARMAESPSAAALELERRIYAIAESKTALGYDERRMRAAAEELINRWPVVQQALERFGADIEGTK